MHVEDFLFNAHDQRLAATRVRPEQNGPVRVMTLHGLGATASRHTARYIIDHLAAHGQGSICFEFSGNGESTGVLEESCLKRRRNEAIEAAAQLDQGIRPVLIGTSMGAHIASWITPVLRPTGLVLFCPAAYPNSAIESPFDDQLARPGRYVDSPAYGGLKEFDGDLLIVGAREDQVVPPGTLEGYLESALRARRRELIWLDRCDHFIHRWLPHQGRARDEVLAAILRVVAASSTGQRECPHAR